MFLLWCTWLQLKIWTVLRIHISMSCHHWKQPDSWSRLAKIFFLLNTLFLQEAFEYSICVIFQTPSSSHKRSKLWDSWKKSGRVCLARDRRTQRSEVKVMLFGFTLPISSFFKNNPKLNWNRKSLQYDILWRTISFHSLAAIEEQLFVWPAYGKQQHILTGSFHNRKDLEPSWAAAKVVTVLSEPHISSTSLHLV